MKKEKTILILGAKSDIAQATAKRFAKNGYNLILAARNFEELAPIQSDLQLKYNVSVSILEFDAVQFDTHSDFYSALSNKPDVVVLAFGVLGEQETEEKKWRDCLNNINVNFVGAVSILNIVANDFESRKEGTIIGISSVAGLRGRKSNYIYGSAKAGFTTYLGGLRNRLFHSDVHVATILPGFVDTKMTQHLDLPKPLLATPKNVASAIYSAYKNKKNVVYSMSIWKWIMLVIRLLPEFVFKRLKL